MPNPLVGGGQNQTDPFGSMQGFMGQFQSFMQNPAQFIMQKRLNIPQSMMNNPQQAVQYLMNNGQMSQQQFNQLQNMAKRIQNNPMFRNMMRK